MVEDKEKLEQGNFHTYFLTFSSDKFPSFTEEGGRDHVKSSGDFFDIKNRPVTEVGLMIKVHIIAFSEKKKNTVTICTSYNKMYSREVKNKIRDSDIQLHSDYLAV